MNLTWIHAAITATVDSYKKIVSSSISFEIHNNRQAITGGAGGKNVEKWNGDKIAERVLIDDNAGKRKSGD